MNPESPGDALDGVSSLLVADPAAFIPEKPFLVGIGAAGGGPDALAELLPLFRKKDFKNTSVIVVQKLPPRGNSPLCRFLSAHSLLEVKEAENKQALEPAVIYVAPMGKTVTVKDGRLFLRKADQGRQMPIDGLFRSMAQSYGSRAVGIILSGSGKDGAKGMAALRKKGGFTLVQDPSSAACYEMPLAVIAAQCADRILGLSKMPATLSGYIRNLQPKNTNINGRPGRDPSQRSKLPGQRHLHTVIKELEISNGELLVRNARIQSANRDIRIAYEELKALHGTLEEKERQLRDANKRLQDKEANLKAVIENFDGYVWSMDRACRYITFNTLLKDKIAEVFKEEIEPGSPVRGIPELFHPSGIGKWEEVCKQALNGEVQHLVHEFNRPEGTIFFELSVNPIYEYDDIIGLSCFARNITEEEINKQLIEANEVRFHSLIENSIDMIMLIDSVGKMIYVSPALEKTIGHPDVEARRQTALDIIHPDDRDKMYNAYKNTLQKPNTPVQLTVRMKNVQSRYIFIEGTITNMFNVKGVQALVFNFRDITEIFRLQHELMEEKVNKQREVTKATIDAQEKERAEIGKELHDNVNQLLSTAKIYLHSAMDDPGGNRDLFVEQSMDLINTGIEEIRRLSKTLVPPSIGDLGLKDSVEDLADTVRLLQGTAVRLELEELDEEMMDHELKLTIFRIIQEQLNNIMKHAAASEIDIALCPGNHTLELLIADNGKGFNFYERRKGIGITNIINRAETYNGKVLIDTAPGRGCRLQVSFLFNTTTERTVPNGAFK